MADGAPWLDDAEMAAWLAFLEVSHRLDRVIEQQLRQDAGLSHAQYEILSRLETAPGGRLRMSELADVIIVSRSGLTYQVTGLQFGDSASGVLSGGLTRDAGESVAGGPYAITQGTLNTADSNYTSGWCVTT